MSSRLIDMTGQVFGYLTVRRLAPKVGRRTKWECDCVCGNKKAVDRDNLISGHTTSCGCKWHEPRFPRVDLTGKKFGRLLVIEYVGRRPGKGDSHWRCKCSCGNESIVAGYNLKCGASRSCGCQIRIALLKVNTKHGRTRTVEYRIWSGMLTRCYNDNEKAYKFYGGRGITVDDRWRGEGGFENFFADMGKRPSKKHQIERNDNDGPYSASNCRWATRVEQGRNKRSTIRTVVDGMTVSLMEACRIKGLNYGTIRSRMFKQGMTFEQAVSCPVGRKPKEMPLRRRSTPS